MVSFLDVFQWGGVRDGVDEQEAVAVLVVDVPHRGIRVLWSAKNVSIKVPPDQQGHDKCELLLCASFPFFSNISLTTLGGNELALSLYLIRSSVSHVVCIGSHSWEIPTPIKAFIRLACIFIPLLSDILTHFDWLLQQSIIIIPISVETA